MLASTSRAVLRSSRSMAAGKAPAFSTSAPASKKKTVVVELLHDVKNLGMRHDHVEISEGQMRNSLAPYRLARYIPYKMPKTAPRVWTTPRGHVAKPDVDGYLEDGSQSHLHPNTPGNTRPAVPTPTELLNKLFLVPETLPFHRRTVGDDTDAIHGSITISDVYIRLAKQHGMKSADFEVNWVDRDEQERMKALGGWPATIAVKGYAGEQIAVTVEVIRQE